MPQNLKDVTCHLQQAYALLDQMSSAWEKDFGLLAQAKIAAEHMRMALDALGQAEEMLSARQQASTE